jgi:hypothetical protein
MSRPERQMRLLQLSCLVVLLASFRLALRVTGTTHGSPNIQWIFIALALVCAIQGFTLQRRIVSPRNQARLRSTPLKRWKAGNFARLGLATAVGLYGLGLSEFGGAAWQVNSLLAMGLVLLLIWRPGTSPNSEDVEQGSRENAR